MSNWKTLQIVNPVGPTNVQILVSFLHYLPHKGSATRIKGFRRIWNWDCCATYGTPFFDCCSLGRTMLLFFSQAICECFSRKIPRGWEIRSCPILQVGKIPPHGCFHFNHGTPKSSILIGFSIIFTIHFGIPLFLEGHPPPWRKNPISFKMSFSILFPKVAVWWKENLWKVRWRTMN